MANAGVVPGAVVAAILDRPFHSMMVSRRYRTETVRATPSVFGEAPSEVRGKRVLIVDETCDSGDTLRLAIAAIVNAGAVELRTAVSFKTGSFVPDFHALALESAIVLPWDREILVDGKAARLGGDADRQRTRDDSEIQPGRRTGLSRTGIAHAFTCARFHASGL